MTSLSWKKSCSMTTYWKKSYSMKSLSRSKTNCSKMTSPLAHR
jgi:hypothetical protein